MPLPDISEWGEDADLPEIPLPERKQGARDGRPLPAAWFNLFGAWISRLAPRAYNEILISPLLAPATLIGSGSFTTTLIPPIGRSLSFTDDNTTAFLLAPIPQSGKISEIETYTSNWSGTAQIQHLILDGDWNPGLSSLAQVIANARASTDSRTFDVSDAGDYVSQDVSNGNNLIEKPGVLFTAITADNHEGLQIRGIRLRYQ